MTRIKSDRIIDMLQDIALGDYPPSQRLSAAKTLLDKAVPNLAAITQAVRHDGHSLSNLSTPELTALLLELAHDPIGPSGISYSDSDGDEGIINSIADPESVGVRNGGGIGELISSDQLSKFPESSTYAPDQDSRVNLLTEDEPEYADGVEIDGEFIPAVSDDYEEELPYLEGEG